MRTITFHTAAVLAAFSFAGVGCEEQPPAPPAAPSATAKPEAKASASASAAKSAEKAEEKAAKLTPEQIGAKVKECFAALDAKDEAKMKACHAENVKFSMVDMIPAMDTEGYDAMVAAHKPMMDAFSDVKHELGLVLVNGTTAAVVGTLRGKNTGEFMGQKATNKEIAVVFASITKMSDDGKATEIKIYSDQTSMAGQLGMLPKDVPADVWRAAADAPAWGETQVILAKGDDAEKALVEMGAKGMESMNKHDAKAHMEGFADDAVFHDTAMKKDIKGKKDIEKGLAEWMKSSSDMKMTVDASWAAGAYLVTAGTSTGTFDHDMGKMKATKKAFTTRSLSVAKVDGGKVKDLWIFDNGFKWAVDVGLAKAPEMPTAKADEGKGDEKKDTKPAKTK
jgi:ketosteroid isomerase-like protein